MIRTDLLETLKEFLKSIPAKKFDLLYWRNRSNSSALFISDMDLHTDCGTTACAMGWAATLPEFKEAGLSFEGSSIVLRNKDGDLLQEDFLAAQELFGFKDLDVVSCLFGNSYYTTDDKSETEIIRPERVIARIEKLLALLEIPAGETLTEFQLEKHEWQAEKEFIRCCSHHPTTY